MIRVGIVEDQTLVREGIERLLLLTDDIRIMARAQDGNEGIRLLSDAALDILLLDLRMPQSSGLDLMREAARTQCATPCIILTTFDDDEDILECIRLGARGVLRKDVSLETLSSAIREVHAGGTLLMPTMTQRLTERLQARSQRSQRGPAPCDKPTDRELQILRLMFAGLSNAEIAYALRLSEGTIKNHVSTILSKLGARDRIRAVMRAVEEGYV